ncbi:ABC transporter substrate-binding protein [Mordavella massiliensis]|uniref:ABC transporter substrate-binding protein n=1 Tax=Mordavella massiliensis TaxID=1871024 RepID=UPI00210B02F1|nr:ABC transporter substrate-binding protein [Mordavella massiliensis]
MRKKIISIILTAVMVLGILAGCSSSEKEAAEGSGGSSSEPLRVALQPVCLGAPVGYAYEKGYYEDEGLDVELTYFDTGAPENEAFAAGQIDIAASGLASVFSLATGNATWVGEINTTGGQGIYFRPDNPAAQVTTTTEQGVEILGDAETVKGMKFLGPLGTSAQYLIMNYCEQLGLSSSDYEIVSMEFGPALQAFKSGEGDAISCDIWYAIEAEEAGFSRAATFEEACGIEPNDGIFVSNTLIEERRDDVVKFLRATYKALEELSDDSVRHEFCLRWYAENGREFTEEQMDKEIERRWYITSEIMEQEDYIMGEGVTAMAEFYVEDGKISEDMFPNVQKSYDPSLLEEALGITIQCDN